MAGVSVGDDRVVDDDMSDDDLSVEDQSATPASSPPVAAYRAAQTQRVLDDPDPRTPVRS